MYSCKENKNDPLWTVWRDVTGTTRTLLTRYQTHCIRLTVNPLEWADALHSEEMRRAKKCESMT